LTVPGGVLPVFHSRVTCGYATEGSTLTADDPAFNWKTSAWIAGGRPATPEEFQGAVHMMSLGAFAQFQYRKKDIGGGVAKTWITFLGDGKGPSMRAAFEGSYDGKRGAAVGAKGLVGYMWLLDRKQSEAFSPLSARDRKKQDQYWSVAVPALQVGFPTNGARLPVPTTDEANEIVAAGSFGIREALEVFAACELPMFDNPMAAINIIGHADRSDTEANNFELSKNRAKSVYHYLRGLLGDTFAEETDPDKHAASPTPRVLVEGRGEDLAKCVDPDDSSNQSFRRADLSFALTDELEGNALEDVFGEGGLSLRVTFRGTGTPKKQGQ
jgi:hypothetical protein